MVLPLTKQKCPILTLSLVNNYIAIRELLMVVLDGGVVMPRAGGVVLNSDQFCGIHVHPITADSCSIFIFDQSTWARL